MPQSSRRGGAGGGIQLRASRTTAFAMLSAAVALGVLAAPSVAAAPLDRQPVAAPAPLTGPALGVRGPVMIGVKAFSPTDVWGVGMQPAQSSTYGEQTQTFAAHFDGTAWTPVPTVSRKYFHGGPRGDGLTTINARSPSTGMVRSGRSCRVPEAIALCTASRRTRATTPGSLGRRPSTARRSSSTGTDRRGPSPVLSPDPRATSCNQSAIAL